MKNIILDVIFRWFTLRRTFPRVWSETGGDGSKSGIIWNSNRTMKRFLVLRSGKLRDILCILNMLSAFHV